MVLKRKFSSYALLGSGRVARHLHFFLNSLNLPLRQWSRNGDPAFNSGEEVDPEQRLQAVLAEASHVLLAVKDEAIEPLSRGLSAEQTVVHFSGALNLANTFAAHPLMTFGDRLETLDWYRRIPFVLDEGQSFADLLPGLPNPHFALAPEQRSYYHALCSLAGNSTYMLWKQIGDEFERTLKLPRALLGPFLHQVVANSSQFAEVNFTGPVAREDWDVVRLHLQSLVQRPELLQAYRHYLNVAAAAGHSLPESLL